MILIKKKTCIRQQMWFKNKKFLGSFIILLKAIMKYMKKIINLILLSGL